MTILVVDDSAAMRSVVKRVIQLSGAAVAEILEAEHAAAALELVGRRTMDLILTDINMPGMAGDEFLRALRQLPAALALPVIVISSDASSERVAQMRALGAAGYLKKPFSPEALRREIERACGEDSQ